MPLQSLMIDCYPTMIGLVNEQFSAMCKLWSMTIVLTWNLFQLDVNQCELKDKWTYTRVNRVVNTHSSYMEFRVGMEM